MDGVLGSVLSCFIPQFLTSPCLVQLTPRKKLIDERLQSFLVSKKVSSCMENYHFVFVKLVWISVLTISFHSGQATGGSQDQLLWVVMRCYLCLAFFKVCIVFTCCMTIVPLSFLFVSFYLIAQLYNQIMKETKCWEFLV